MKPNRVFSSLVAISVVGAGITLGVAAPSREVYAQSGHGMGGPGMGWGRDYWMPGWMHRRHWDSKGMNQDMRARMQRHWTYMHEGLPSEYAGVTSDAKAKIETIAEGAALYSRNCASCHGKTGLGDGEAGRSLTPSPALLAYLIQRPVAADEYLLWSISEGGKPFGTAMPAYKEKLNREQIWKIITYMRAGFPELQSAK